MHNLKNKLSLYIFMGLTLGLLTGYVCHVFIPLAGTRETVAEDFNIVTMAFIRLIQMIIAPLIISTLITGISKNSDIKSIGRVGLKTLFIFFVASIISITLGLIIVNVFRPGDALNLSIISNLHDSLNIQEHISLKTFIVHAIPRSIIEAMANNEILQVVIFSVFFGTALAALGESAKKLNEILDIIAKTMFILTSYVMKFAPIAIFASIAALITKNGLSILAVYGLFISEFYISILLLLLIVTLLSATIIHKKIFSLMKVIQEPVLLAFMTASSEAAFPKTLNQLEIFGISNKTAAFVLPLGYSFNLIGSMLYCAFGTMFIAQAYKIYLSPSQQIIMLLVLMLTSKGIAGVPRASLIAISAVLSQFKIPQEGLLLLVAVDHFFDMGRSAVNVVGNSFAAAVVAKWEKEI